MKKLNTTFVIALLLTVFALSSCSGNSNAESDSSSGEANAATSGETNLELTVGDSIQFDTTELTVNEGDKVTLTPYVSS